MHSICQSNETSDKRQLGAGVGHGCRKRGERTLGYGGYRAQRTRTSKSELLLFFTFLAYFLFTLVAQFCCCCCFLLLLRHFAHCCYLFCINQIEMNSCVTLATVSMRRHLNIIISQYNWEKQANNTQKPNSQIPIYGCGRSTCCYFVHSLIT